MKGKITKYFEDKGFGFIIDTDGNNRFFHVSDIKSIEPIINYSEVEFRPSKNEKGLSANDIFIITNKKPQFIIFGDVRIKLSNIKSYGMDIATHVEFREEEMTNLTLFGMLFDRMTGQGNTQPPLKEIKTKYNVLYVTTYQGNNYRFSERVEKFDINEKMKELDNYFTV